MRLKLKGTYRNLKNSRGRWVQSLILQQVSRSFWNSKCSRKKSGIDQLDVTKYIFKIYSRIDLYYQIKISSNFEFSDRNEVCHFEVFLHTITEPLIFLLVTFSNIYIL